MINDALSIFKHICYDWNINIETSSSIMRSFSILILQALDNFLVSDGMDGTLRDNYRASGPLAMQTDSHRSVSPADMIYTTHQIH